MNELSKKMTLLLRSAFNSARRRAQKRAEPFNLTLNFLATLWLEQKGRCALSNISFNCEIFDSAFVKRPFAASIDRIDSSKYYTRDNIRLICTAVNFARGQWGDDVLRQVAHGIVEKEKDQEKQWYKLKKEELIKEKEFLKTVDGIEYAHLKQRIAGMKAVLTKGPARLRSAGRKAAKERLKK